MLARPARLSARSGAGVAAASAWRALASMTFKHSTVGTAEVDKLLAGPHERHLSRQMPEHKVLSMTGNSENEPEWATVIEWKVKEGDGFSEGDVLAYVENYRMPLEWKAAEDGVVAKLLVVEEEDVFTGEPLLISVAPFTDIDAFAEVKSRIVRRREIVYPPRAGDAHAERDASIISARTARKLEALSKDRDAAVVHVQKNGRVLRYLSDALRADRDIVLAAVRNYGRALEYASDVLRAETDVVRAAVQNDGQALKYAADELRADMNVVLAALQRDKSTLQFASEELCAEAPVVLAAIPRGDLLPVFADKLKVDREFMLAAVQINGRALEYASTKIRADREVVLAALQAQGNRSNRSPNDRLFSYVSSTLRDDRDVMMAAVKLDSSNLKYASDALRADTAIVRAAVQNDGQALKYASDALRADTAIVCAAVQNASGALEYASTKLRSNRDIVLAAVEHNNSALAYASDELRADRSVVLAAAQPRSIRGGDPLEFASDEVRADRDVVLAAFQNAANVKRAEKAKEEEKQIAEMWKKRHRARKEEVARAMGEDVPSSADEAELDDETFLGSSPPTASRLLLPLALPCPAFRLWATHLTNSRRIPLSSELRIYRRRI